jgi:cytochrome c oxidase assembly factor CtaG
MAAISIAAAAFAYAGGVARVWRTAGIGRGILKYQVLCYAAGLVAITVALISPLDRLSDESFAAHMLQHELLMVVAAPAIGYGAGHLALIWLMPARWRRRAWRWAATPLASTGAACLAHAAVLWLWHMPLLFDAALRHEGLHVVQHLSFVATGAWFWASLAHGRYGRAGFGAAVVYLFATAVESGALGALLVFSPLVWYLIDAAALAAHGLTPLEDQQLAGLLMWVPASLIFAGAGLAFFAAWMRESGRRASLGSGRRAPAYPGRSSSEATKLTKI